MTLVWHSSMTYNIQSTFRDQTKPGIAPLQLLVVSPPFPPKWVVLSSISRETYLAHEHYKLWGGRVMQQGLNLTWEWWLQVLEDLMEKRKRCCETGGSTRQRLGRNGYFLTKKEETLSSVMRGIHVQTGKNRLWSVLWEQFGPIPFLLFCFIGPFSFGDMPGTAFRDISRQWLGNHIGC